MIEMRRVIDIFVGILVITDVNVRMYMGRAVVSVRVRVDEEIVGLRRRPAHSMRSLPDQAGGCADAEQNQDDCHREFHRKSEPGRDRNFENDDRSADDQHGDGVAESPYHADARGDGEPTFAA